MRWTSLGNRQRREFHFVWVDVWERKDGLERLGDAVGDGEEQSLLLNT